MDIVVILLIVILSMFFGMTISIIIDHEYSIKKMNRTLREIDAKIERGKRFEAEVEERSISPPARGKETGTIIDIVA